MGEMIAGELPQIVFEESVTSTNDVAIEHGREGAPHGWCVCAQEQNGRSRQARSRMDPRLRGHLSSCVLRPGVRMQEFTALPAVRAMGDRYTCASLVWLSARALAA